MYKGDSTLRSIDEAVELEQWQIEEYIRCKKDIIYFAEKYFKIINIDEGEITIQLREYQKKILKAFFEPQDNKRHCAVLAGRQVGKSTISTVYILHYALFNADKTIAILANKETTAIEILDRIKLAYSKLPLWLQLGIHNDGWNKKSIKLENNTKIIVAATSKSAISGLSISLLYIDEFAKIQDSLAQDFMDSVFPTIMSAKTSRIMIISTPTGLNHWYRIWKSSISGENDFFPIKINWWEIPGRDDEFRKSIIRNFGKNHWNQEYAASFIGSSKTLIDPDILEGIKTKEPHSYRLSDRMMIYEPPISGTKYVLGVDVSKGTKRNYSVVQVIKINSHIDLEQVAIFRSNTISTNDYAQVIIEISKYYNNAMIMIENNSVGEGVANSIWHVYEYEYMVNLDKTGALGVNSNKRTKLQANLILKKYLEKYWLKLVDKTTVFELSQYEEDSNRLNSFSNQNGDDDCVAALLWAVYFMETIFFDGEWLHSSDIDPQNMIKDEDDGIPVIFVPNSSGLDAETEDFLNGDIGIVDNESTII